MDNITCGEGNGTPLRYSCLENPMDRGAWQSMGLRRARHDWATLLSLFTFHFHALEKEMATHSSVLAWRIPGMVEPGGLPSLGSHRVTHDWSDLASAAAAGSFRKGRGTRDQIANICWIMVKGREFQKNIYFCFIDYAKAFDCVDHDKVENSERDGNTRPPVLPPEKSVSRSRSNS